MPITAASPTPHARSLPGRCRSKPIARVAERPRFDSRYSARTTGTSVNTMLSTWYVRSRYGRADWLVLMAVVWPLRGPCDKAATSATIA
jgi:hypothetical protein